MCVDEVAAAWMPAVVVAVGADEGGASLVTYGTIHEGKWSGVEDGKGAERGKDERGPSLMRLRRVNEI